MTLIRSAIALILAAFIAPLAAPALAGPAIEVAEAWARPSIPNRPGAAYLEIHNTGDTPDRLVGVRAEGAGAAELHKAEEKDGMMTMAPVKAIEVPPGRMVRLVPGGFHIMLFDLAEPLAEGHTLALTLEFEESGEIAVEAPVMRRAKGGGMGGGMQHGSGQGMGGGAGN